MHEEALVRDLLAKVEEVARAHGGARVRRVQLWVGALSHFSESGLRNRWAVAAQGTVAEGSRLEVTMSADPHHSRAQEIVLETLDLGDPAGFSEPRRDGRVSRDPPSS